MFKRFFRWLTSPIEVESLPERTEEILAKRKGGIFSTHSPERDPAAQLMAFAEMTAALAKRAPVAHLKGVAMDSSDGQMTTTGIKDAYNLAQPNVSMAIVGWFLSQGFIGHQMAGMIAQHWLIDKCCKMPARDAVRNGYKIHTSDGDELNAPEVLRMMKRADKRYNIDRQLVEYVHKGKIFGIRIAFFKVNSTDPNYYEMPFNPDGVTPGSYKGIVQVDPYWCSPVLDQRATADPSSMHFYEPTWWQISGKLYHRSHLMIYREGDVIDILKPSYLYGGVPVPQKIMERVYAAERTANEAPQLAMTKRTTVIGTDLEDGMIFGPETNEKFANYADLRDNYGVWVTDSKDTVANLDTSLGDLDAVIMSQYQIVAAAADVPATKLLGTTPKGFSATGEYDEANYHEELESIQTDKLTPFMDRHHQLVMLSDVVPRMRRVDPNFEPLDTTVAWESLDSMTAKEQADTNLVKAQTDAALIATGAVDSYDIRDRLIADPDSGYGSIETVTRPDDDGDGTPDAPKLVAAAPAPSTVAMDASEVQLITNQMFLDPEVVQQKQLNKDYRVRVTPALPDPDTGMMYRIVLDGHHSLAAARIDGVPPQLEEGGYGEGDYFDAESGDPLAQA